MRLTAKSSIAIIVLIYLTLSVTCLNLKAVTNQEEITRLINEGITYHSNRNYLLAIQSFERAQELDPLNKQILANLSIVHNNYGKYLAERTDAAGAAREFRTALFYNPSNDVARSNLEFKLKEMGQSTTDCQKRIVQAQQERLNENFLASIAELREANRIKESVDAYMEIGINYHLMSLRSRNDQTFMENAVDSFNKAISLSPDDPRPYVKLGDVYIAVGQISKGIDYYEQAIKRSPSDKEAQNALINGWLAAIRVAPHLANNHIGLGTAYQLRGDFPQAQRSFTRALELDPNNLLAKKGMESLKEDSIKTQVNLFLDRAVSLQKQNNFDESLTYYIKALNLEPNNPDIHYNIGTAFQAKGDLVRARKAYNKAAELQAGHVEATTALAELNAEQKQQQITQAFDAAVNLQQGGKYQEAISIYSKMLVDKPNDDTLYYNLGVAYQGTGDIEAALTNYNKAYSLKADASYKDAIRSAEITKANKLLARAIDLQSKADNNEAINLYNQVIKLVPENANAWYNLGTAYQAVGDDAKAFTAYEKAYTLDPKNQTEAMFFAAMILEDQRQLLKAMDLYGKYLSLSPTGDYAGEAKGRQAYIKKFL